MANRTVNSVKGVLKSLKFFPWLAPRSWHPGSLCESSLGVFDRLFQEILGER